MGAEEQPPLMALVKMVSLGGGTLGAGSRGKAKEASGSGELGGDKDSKPKVGLCGSGSRGEIEG